MPKTFEFKFVKLPVYGKVKLPNDHCLLLNESVRVLTDISTDVYFHLLLCIMTLYHYSCSHLPSIHHIQTTRYVIVMHQ